jgi:hypothetical protein
MESKGRMNPATSLRTAIRKWFLPADNGTAVWLLGLVVVATCAVNRYAGDS